MEVSFQRLIACICCVEICLALGCSPADSPAQQRGASTIALGASQDEVVRAMGSPTSVDKLTGGGEMWLFISFPTDQTGKPRDVGEIGGTQIFFKEGKVYEVRPILHSSSHK